MRMELRGRSGELIGQLPWPGAAIVADELRTKAKAALAGFYEADANVFWPKQRFEANPPQEVRMVGDDGSILASYTIDDMSRDTSRSFVARPKS